MAAKLRPLYREIAATVVVTSRPMLMAKSNSTIVAPARDRRRAGLSVNVVLKSIARDEGADLPLAGDIARSPGNIHDHPFQIAAVIGTDRGVVDRHGAEVNGRAGHSALGVIGSL